MASDKHSILVTGGCGFIGSNLVRELAKQPNNQIIVFDNLQTGNYSTIEDLVVSHRIKFIQGDITDLRAVTEACHNIDHVIHLAALIDAEDSVKNPLSYLKTNTLGTTNLLSASVENSVDGFVFASTAAVYGHSQRTPIPETDPTTPLSPYGQSKLYAEDRIKNFMKDYGLNAKILRLFNVYGQKMVKNSYAGVITKFLNNLLNKQDLVVYGDGKQTRDFVHISDVIAGFRQALESNSNGIFNIGTGTAVSIDTLARMVLALNEENSNLKITHKDSRKGDIRDSCADISHAVSELGYRPRISLEDGLLELHKSCLVIAPKVATR